MANYGGGGNHSRDFKFVVRKVVPEAPTLDEPQCLILDFTFLNVQSILTQPVLTLCICGSMAVPRSISTAPFLSLPSLQSSSFVRPV